MTLMKAVIIMCERRQNVKKRVHSVPKDNHLQLHKSHQTPPGQCRRSATLIEVARWQTQAIDSPHKPPNAPELAWA